jgi:hypothetical protein
MCSRPTHQWPRSLSRIPYSNLDQFKGFLYSFLFGLEDMHSSTYMLYALGFLFNPIHWLFWPFFSSMFYILSVSILILWEERERERGTTSFVKTWSICANFQLPLHKISYTTIEFHKTNFKQSRLTTWAPSSLFLNLEVLWAWKSRWDFFFFLISNKLVLLKA